MINIKELTIKSAKEHLENGDFTAKDLTTALLSEIEKKNKKLNIYLEVFDDAILQAKEADKKIAAKEKGNLLGIPIAVKDNILISGRRTGAASKILEGFIAPHDATIISKLKKEGAIFLGRTNMDEFAMGGSNENSAYGPVKNPHDESRVTGGSSGGSAAAVAADLAIAALGSDTGGSVRQPASLCGVVGFKPTYGRISRYGLIAMGSSLDQIGTLTKNVVDAELLYEIMKGKDEMDSTTIPDDSSVGMKKMKVGIPRHFMKEGIDKEVLANFEKSVAKIKSFGHEIVDITIANISYSLAVYYVIMPAEASSNLARFDGVKYGFHKNGGTLLGDYLETRTAGFGQEVRRRIMIGNYILSSGYYEAYYRKANNVRNLLEKEFNAAFDKVDAVLTPTSPVPAFKIGEKSTDPLSMYLADIFTVTANLIGAPAISIPDGSVRRDGKNLPTGIQFMSKQGREDVLFDIGKQMLGS